MAYPLGFAAAGGDSGDAESQEDHACRFRNRVVVDVGEDGKVSASVGGNVFQGLGDGGADHGVAGCGQGVVEARAVVAPDAVGVVGVVPSGGAVGLAEVADVIGSDPVAESAAHEEDVETVVHSAGSGWVLGVDEAIVGVVVPGAASGDWVEEPAGVVCGRVGDGVEGVLRRRLPVHVADHHDLVVRREAVGVVADIVGFDLAAILVGGRASSLHMEVVDAKDFAVGGVVVEGEIEAPNVTGVGRGSAGRGDEVAGDSADFGGAIEHRGVARGVGAGQRAVGDRPVAR